MVDNFYSKGSGLIRYCYLVPVYDRVTTNDNCNRKVNIISAFLIRSMRITRTFALIVPLIISLVFFPSTFADHGQEVKLTLDYAHFLPVLIDENSNQTGQQVKVILNYTTVNSSVLNQTINAVMKVYTSNKTLIKTSSFPGGFIANSSDVQQLATTLVDSKLQNVTAVVQFTDAAKMVPMSNSVVINLNFGNRIET
jgi:hypothetical protein